MSNEILPLDTEEVELPVVEKKIPKRWSDLNKAEVKAAAEYFGTKDEGTTKEMLTDLEDASVTWEMYAVAFGHAEAPVEEERIPTKLEEDEIEWIDEEVEEVNEPITVPRVKQMAPTDKYLIKFIGQNPYFERGKYKFTAEKPYAIMTAADAQDALVDEPKKFRQAFPDELAEFMS